MIYETFSSGQLERPDNHIRNPGFTLSEDELPTLYSSFEVLSHHERVLPDRTVRQFFARKR